MEKQIGLLNLLDKNILYVIGVEFWNLEKFNLSANDNPAGNWELASGRSDNCIRSRNNGKWYEPKLCTLRRKKWYKERKNNWKEKNKQQR